MAYTADHRVAHPWDLDALAGAGAIRSTANGMLNPAGAYAGVVLLNTTVGATGSFADLVGHHVEQRLTGQPAVSLGN